MPTVEELTDDLANAKTQLASANLQITTLDMVITQLQATVKVLEDERNAVREAFITHKAETQKRLDELSKVENFSWEKYHRILEEHKLFGEQVKELTEQNKLLTEDSTQLKNRLANVESAFQVEQRRAQSLGAIISSHETTIKSLRHQLEELETLKAAGT